MCSTFLPKVLLAGTSTEATRGGARAGAQRASAEPLAQRRDRVTVIGAGTVGCLVAWVLRTTVGCEVELVDINPQRHAIAARLGLPFKSPDAMSSDRTIVVHTSGSEAGDVQGALETGLKFQAMLKDLENDPDSGCKFQTLFNPIQSSMAMPIS